MSVLELDTRSELDLEQIFNDSDDVWCHLTSPGEELALCGHKPHQPDHPITWDDGGSVCPGCGRPTCPDCRYLERQCSR